MIDQETFYVDKTPPVTTKTYIGPQWPDPITDNPYPHWVDTVTEVELTATDSIGPHDSGIKETMYRVTTVPDMYCDSQYDCEMHATGSGSFVPYTGTFTLSESCQFIEYYSVDNVDKTETTKKQCVYSDHTKPVAYFDGIVGPQIDCRDYPSMCMQGQDYWVANHVSTVNLGCRIGPSEPHPAPLDKIYWRIDIDGTGWGPWQQADVSQGASVIFTEDSVHTLEYYCTDKVQKVSNTQTKVFKVDSTPPEINKVVSDPWIACPPQEPNSNSHGPMDCYFIDGLTEITVDAVDPDPTGFGCAVDNIVCEWGYSWMGQYYGPFPEQTLPFIISGLEESEHILDIRCWDALGNEVTDVEKFIVDKTPPVTTKWYEGPQYSDGLPEYSFQTFSQDIEGSDYDLEVTVEDDGTWIIWNFDFPVETFTGDGNLNLGLIIALDGEGNGPAFQIHNDDGADPLIEDGTWVMSPFDTELNSGCNWIGWHSGCVNTPVTDLSWVEATGNRNVPHGEGILQVKIKKSELGESFHWAASPTVGSGFWDAYDVTMQIPTGFNWGTPLVDMDVPNYEYAESVEGEYPKWITSETEVHLSASDDEGPHDSGVAATYWRNTLLVDDESCWNQELCQQAEGSGDWNLYEGSFKKGEESCHLIEYYSVDNVGKTEEVNKQCVFVDNTPPEPDKRVGKPSTQWDGSDAYFYDIADRCWNESGDFLECWKVTTLTPVTLDCEDQGDHPVDHEKIWFNVDLDGEDVTEDYCEKEEINGYFDEETGFCLIEGEEAPVTFYFGEESEHNLEYYCIDALGNEGPVDEEKFKVEGTAFEIQLNKKWNLISVPFVMLNDSIEEVFKDIADDVESVWTYDAETEEWYVYTPGPAPDTLNEMIPGWGYWVLAKSDTTLLIGGSLFSPGKTPPSKDIVSGWNLIGYWGTEDGEILEYDGPDGDGRDAYCELYSLGEDMWDKEFASLLTYWEPDNPEQWKKFDEWDSMDPGAGYWLFTLQEGEYVVPTACGIWF